MEGHSSNMKKSLLFCKSPHVAGTIGELAREVISGLDESGFEVYCLSSCEPVSYVEPVEGLGYPILVNGKNIYCACGSENIIVSIYEHLTSVRPDVIFSIGERAEAELVSAAIQVSGFTVRHVHLWIGSSEPSRSSCESMARVDDVLCFGNTAKSNMEGFVKNIHSMEIRSSINAYDNNDSTSRGILCGCLRTMFPIYFAL